MITGYPVTKYHVNSKYKDYNKGPYVCLFVVFLPAKESSLNGDILIADILTYAW